MASQNGDPHRAYIHLVEFVLFFLFFCAFVWKGYEQLTKKLDLSAWPANLSLSVASLVFGFALFALSGGSAHGDGGPITVVFGTFGVLGTLGIPICLGGWLVASLNH